MNCGCLFSLSSFSYFLLLCHSKAPLFPGNAASYFQSPNISWIWGVWLSPVCRLLIQMHASKFAYFFLVYLSQVGLIIRPAERILKGRGKFLSYTCNLFHMYRQKPWEYPSPSPPHCTLISQKILIILSFKDIQNPTILYYLFLLSTGMVIISNQDDGNNS